MTEKIQQIIQDIRSKAVETHGQLLASKEVNQQLQSENQSLNSKIQELSSINGALQIEIQELKMELTKMKEEVVNSSSGTAVVRNEEEIDALVKEIEYCITQLKK